MLKWRILFKLLGIKVANNINFVLQISLLLNYIIFKQFLTWFHNFCSDRIS